MKQKVILKAIAAVVLATLILSVFGPTAAFAQMTGAGIQIFNQAKADYLDEAGNRFSAMSTRVVFTVRAVPRITVTPDETDPSAIIAPRERIVRNFRFCNTGNVTDQYVISSLDASSPSAVAGIFFDVDANGTISGGDIPATVNSTRSPQLAAGACLGVLTEIDTNDIAVGGRLTIDIAMRSDSAPDVSDTGRIINIVGNGAILTSPDDPNAPPLKLVNGQRTYVGAPGERLTYTIAFRNRGDVSAQNVVITDDLPNELRYASGSLRIENRPLTDAAGDDEGSAAGQRIEFRLAQPVAPNAVVNLTFQATLTGQIPAGTGVSNVANLTATNAPATVSNPAIVIVNPFGIVYSGNSGAGVPIAGANVTVFSDSQMTTPVVFPPIGFEPNTDNVNPFVSDSQGRYSFAFGQSASLVETPYFVNVTAESYRARMLEVTATPDAGGLFDLRVRSLDGMPIAVAGGFELTTENVAINDVAAIAMNIPMFARSSLEISKSADRAQAEIGENVTYRIDVHNGGTEQLSNVTVADTLPQSFSYIPGTARIIRDRTETPTEPQTNGGQIVFNLGTLGAGERLSLTYRVRIGVNAQPGDQYNVAVASGIFPNGDQISTAPARAAVRISGGLFSMRQVVVGRVFLDANKNGKFDKGEKGVAGIRLYLANGTSVVTDTNGLYSLPAVAEGAQVIEIDPLTIPAGLFPATPSTRAERTWTRLMRAPIGGGMLRQNFALVAGPSTTSRTIIPVSEDFWTVNARFDGSDVVKGAEKAAEKGTGKGTEKGTEKPGTRTVIEVPARPVTPLPAGELRIENLTDKEVVKSPAMNLEVSVAANWTVDVRLNDQEVSDTSIGTTREDHMNQITTYTFVGLGLKAGPNTLRVSGRGPQGETTATREVVIFGRGRARRIEIEPFKRELQASGRDRTLVRLRAVDEWNNPAQDAAIAVQTNNGQIVTPKITLPKNDEPAGTVAPESEILQQATIGLVDGNAEFELVSGNQTGEAELKAVLGNAEAKTKIRFIPENRPAILVGLAEFTFGRNAPDNEVFKTDSSVRGRLQFFFRGPVFGERNLLTLGYDSSRSLNRIAGQDRMFQLSPLERTYPILGDSSTRFQETESNSKVYARLDRGRNYGMFGDFNADLSGGRLLGYDRKLTGVKLHLENSGGDFVTVTGARPDTAFARQVIPGGSLSIVQLDFPDILPGSETINLEVRDRRNPEIILNRELLTRGIDYNLDLAGGFITFLRPISALDYELNLIQVVATYEHRANGLSSGVYTARAVKNFDRAGLRLGFSMIEQRQKNEAPFRLLGLDFTQKLPGSGTLDGEFAMSRGFVAGANSGISDAVGDGGNAFFVTLNQPLPKFFRGSLKAEVAHASEHFNNPFGATVTPGSTRGVVGLEVRPFDRSSIKFNLMNERNKTSNVDNSRTTAGVAWTQSLTSAFRINVGYDFRSLTDSLAGRKTNSNLLTVGADWKPTDRLEFAVKREQNLSDPDPSFPNQTTFSAGYRLNESSKIFFTQRLASAEISPIADVGGTGFAASKARRETAIGVESKFSRYSTVVGRYQLENGVNARDSFAVVGLNNRLPLKKTLALEFGFERGFHIAGNDKSFNGFYFGSNWTPHDSFRASARFELRDRNGLSKSFSAGTAGVIKPGWTTLARFQYAKIALGERSNRIVDAEVAAAIRPHDTDKYGILLSYNHRNSFLANKLSEAPTRLRADTFSADGFYQINPRLEFYGRSAMRLSGDGSPTLPYASTLTYLLQARLQYRLTERMDLAGETRSIFQPASNSFRTNYAIETGFWATPDLRIGVGYNLRRMTDAGSPNSGRGGFYFSITTKLSNLFDLFGTSKKGLKAPDEPVRTNTADALAVNR